jgi:hypothetical protein
MEGRGNLLEVGEEDVVGDGADDDGPDVVGEDY